jgi:hypothetical protein
MQRIVALLVLVLALTYIVRRIKVALGGASSKNRGGGCGGCGCSKR